MMETLNGPPAEIIKAKIAVMKDAHGVGKTGHNKFHNYAYASDFDVLSLVQPSMAKHGLALAMWCTSTEGPDDNGNMLVHFAMQWQHESGEVSEPLPWIGVAQDRDKQGRLQDKWFNKAATAAEKYFLLKQFHIPTGRDLDPDASTQEENPPYKAPPKRAQQQSAPKAQAQASKPNGATAPSEPPPLAIPHPVPDGTEEEWRKWISDMTAAAGNCAAVAELSALDEANRDGMEALKAVWLNGYTACRGKLKKRFGELSAVAGV